MDKKVVIIGSAVLAFFAGAIWVSEVPVVATLVAFLEVCAGFACGFFYKKVLGNKEYDELGADFDALLDKYKELQKKVTKEISSKKKSAKKTE